MPTTHRLFTTCALPFHYDRYAPRPGLFLDKLLGYQWWDDAESVDVLQEWFGYCLTADNRRMQKMLLLHGETGTGKSVLADVLRLLLGADNCAEVDTKALQDSHGTENLPGKLLITFSDSRTSDRSDNLSLLQFLLKAIGEDPIPINPKGKRRYDAHLTAKVMMVCNELPYLQDSSGAMDRRLLLLHTPRTVTDEDRDDYLRDKLTDELPGILNWALEGRARLLARGKFVQPKSGLPLLEQARIDANPVLPFVEERCCLGGVDHQVDATRLRENYAEWCTARGLKPFSLSAFGRCLSRAARTLGGTVERVRDADPDRHGGKLPAKYVGICLRGMCNCVRSQPTTISPARPGSGT
jgi:putative DNA primase/helicase